MSCNCNISLSNTGVSSCKSIMSVAKKLILVPIYSDAGDRNAIDLVNDIIDSVYFSNKVNEADSSKRWYPLPLIDNVEDTKADPIVEGLNSGQNIIVQDGTRTFTGVLVKQSTEFLKKLQIFKCSNIGVYVIDKEGQLIGTISDDGTKLYPTLIDANTLDIRLMKSTDSTVQKLMVSFEFDQTENDAELSLLSRDEVGTNLLLLDGLIDVNLTTSNITQTGVTVTAILDYGTAKNKLKQKGLTSTDFTIYNVTDSAPVVVASSTETSDGIYDITFVSQSVNDNLTVTASKTGLSFNTASFTIGS
jgi:hypothetical protein